MYSEQAQTSRRLLAAAASLAVNGSLIVVLLWGLASTGNESAVEREAALTTVEFRPEPRPKPPPKEPATNLDDHSAGQIGKSSPIVEPPVVLPAQMQPAAPVAGTGLATGSGNAGPGTGSGSGGKGAGSGGAGSGSPPVRITGTLRDTDYPREAQAAQLAGTVGISFRVRTDGKVDRCTVERLSG